MKKLVLLLLLASLLLTGCNKDNVQKVDGLEVGEAKSSIQPEIIYVKTMAAAPMEFTNKISLPGALHPKEEVIITAKVSGSVEGIFGDIGDVVKNDQLLCKIDDTIFKLQYDKAVTGLNVEKLKSDNTQKSFDRFKALYENKAISQAEFEGVETQYRMSKETLDLAYNDYNLAKENLEYTKIYTPISGIISMKNVATGENIGPGKTLFTIVNIDSLYVEIGVSEKDIASVKVGKEVSVRVDSLPDKSIKGKVTNISPVPKEPSKTYPVKILIDNKEKLFKPGMFTTVEILIEARKNIIGIPKTAVIQENGRHYVFVEKEGKAIKKEVSVGMVNDGYQEINDGIERDENVIIVGHEKLVDNSVVEVR